MVSDGPAGVLIVTRPLWDKLLLTLRGMLERGDLDDLAPLALVAGSVTNRHDDHIIVQVSQVFAMEGEEGEVLPILEAAADMVRRQL